MGQCSNCCSKNDQIEQTLSYYKICILHDEDRRILPNLKTDFSEKTTLSNPKFITSDLECDLSVGLEKRYLLNLWYKSILSQNLGDENETNPKIFKDLEKKSNQIFYNKCDIIILFINMDEEQSIKKVVENNCIKEIQEVTNHSEIGMQIPTFLLGVTLETHKTDSEKDDIIEDELMVLAKRFDWGFGFAKNKEEIQLMVINFARIAYEIGVPIRLGEKGEKELIINGSQYLNQSPREYNLKNKFEKFPEENSIFEEHQKE